MAGEQHTNQETNTPNTPNKPSAQQQSSQQDFSTNHKKKERYLGITHGENINPKFKASW